MTKKLILPTKRGNISNVTVVPTVEALASDAKAIIGKQLSLLRHKSDKGLTLDSKEARQVRDYLDVMVKLLKEERESAKADDLSDMSAEDLVKLLRDLESDPKAVPGSSGSEG